MNSVGLLVPDVRYYSAQSQGMDSFINEFIEIMQNFCPIIFQVRSQVPRSRAQRSCAPHRDVFALQTCIPPTPHTAAADGDEAQQPVMLQLRLRPQAHKIHHVLLARSP